MNDAKNARPIAGTIEQAAEVCSGEQLSIFQNTMIENHGQEVANGCIAKLLCAGTENAVHLRDLALILRWSEREVRSEIARERHRGVPILSDNQSGYFLPATDEERRRCVSSLRHRAAEILKAASAIERGCSNG